MISRTSTSLTVATLAFAMVFGAFAPVAAAPDVGEETRFFVQTTSGFWKNALGVRNEFDNGFTTDNVGFQIRLAKLMGISVIPVQRLSILPTEQVADPAARGGTPGKPTPTPDPGPDPTPTPEPSPEPRPTPNNQLPWGVLAVTGGTGSGASVSVAVLDTGVMKEHPDLSRRIVECTDFSHRRKAMIEDQCDDGNGHGTHVTGIIAADGGEDGLGIFGVAPDANILVYKVCGKNGSCWSDDIANAIRHAADVGAHVINMSLGSDNYSSLIGDAVVYAVSRGTLVVAAAGNDGPYTNSIDYPGALTDVVAVGAFNEGRLIADWSSRGNNGASEPYVTEEGDIELAAPGVNIEAPYVDGGYAILSGTSMASPHIAGLAAVLWDAESDDSSGEVRGLLHSMSIDLDPSGDDEASGWGMPRLP